jgi:hypothetical protein
MRQIEGFGLNLGLDEKSATGVVANGIQPVDQPQRVVMPAGA